MVAVGDTTPNSSPPMRASRSLGLLLDLADQSGHPRHDK
jgi:hypothetical protein